MATTFQYYGFISLLLVLLSITAFPERCHPNDKKALLEIKNGLNSPRNMVSWDPNIDCCEWNHVAECDDKTNRITVFSLLLVDLNLPIPTAIADLTFLEELIFHKTNLTGQIPRSITKLSRLKFLDLSWNHLSGEIPSFLNQLTNLETLVLSFNNFIGSIPGSISQIPNLSGLLLDRNRFTGKIPESFGELGRQTDFFYLYMSHNQLSGQIPAKLGYTNFTLIDVSRNRLEGDISVLFGKNKSVIYADFSRNMLRFDFSKMEFPTSLTTLDLNHNSITGRLPEGLVGLRLDRLNVSYNRLCGRIPVGGRLQEQEITSYLHNRCLCGAPLQECK